MKINNYMFKTGVCIGLLAAIILSSCSTDRVVSSSFIQKRKYTKGFHLSFAKEIHREAQPVTVSKVQAQPGKNKQVSISALAEPETLQQAAKVVVMHSVAVKERKNLADVASAEQSITYIADKGFYPLSAPIKISDGKRTSGLAILSFIFSVLGFITPITLIGFIFGIIFGFVALNKIKKNPDSKKGKGWAKAGIIIGFIGLILVLLVIAVLAVSGFGVAWFAMP